MSRRTALLRGVRANASRLSHAELDDSLDLDDGDPAEFGAQLVAVNTAHEPASPSAPPTHIRAVARAAMC